MPRFTLISARWDRLNGSAGDWCCKTRGAGGLANSLNDALTVALNDALTTIVFSLGVSWVRFGRGDVVAPEWPDTVTSFREPQ